MSTDNWDSNRSLVMSKIDELSSDVRTIFKQMEDIKISLAVLQSKVYTGTALVSILISALAAWIGQQF